MARINTLDREAYYNYMKLDTGDKVLATYIWIDGTGQVRSLVFVVSDLFLHFGCVQTLWDPLYSYIFRLPHLTFSALSTH